MLFSVDIGKGTQDILIERPGLNRENWIKAVLPSPTVLKAREIERKERNLYIGGYTMGGGPVKRAVINHLKKGFKIFMTEEAARTINDDINIVREIGIEVVDRIDHPDILLSDLTTDVYQSLLKFSDISEKPKFAVACQDHGFIKGQRDRVTRFQYFKKALSKNRDPRSLYFTERTGFFSRFDSILKQLKEKGFEGFVMDSKIASICGILEYARELGISEFVGLDIGNGHTLGVSIKNGKVAGIFEHHTRMLTPAKLLRLVDKLIRGVLTFKEVFDDGGHGALVFEPINPEKVLIAGPNRNLFKEYGDYAYPWGDVMMTGCVGLHVVGKFIYHN